MQATQTSSLGARLRGWQFDSAPNIAALWRQPARYNTARMNRHDGPEDGALAGPLRPSGC